jgi:hypothetical protein
MNEAIIETYLDVIQEGSFVIQEGELEHMSEGLREFVSKFNKASLKRMIDKLHHAFSNGDGVAFDSVVKQTAKIGKMPKVKEVSDFMGKAKEENPGFGDSVDLAKKVIKNTFKIRDKAKLEMVANMVGLAGWIKSKGGKTDPVRETKITLQDINSRVNNVYDTGFENMESSTPEEEELKRKMMEQAKKQEKKEMIVVAIVLIVTVGAVVWAGIAVWTFLTSFMFVGTVAAVAGGALLLKILMYAVGIAAVASGGIIAYLKATGGS